MQLSRGKLDAALDLADHFHVVFGQRGLETDTELVGLFLAPVWVSTEVTPAGSGYSDRKASRKASRKAGRYRGDE